MHKGRKIVAWWLLLLLVRVLTPEATVLLLHFHEHTQEASSGPAVAKSRTQTELSPEHKHCHAEQLYNTPFQPGLPVSAPAPLRLYRYATYRPLAPVCRASHLLDGASLRGPPAYCA
ncbi:hypothetical protein ACW9KT_09400 [Hymenobacter sp. HD11105]